MAKLFAKAERGFTTTAATLINLNPNQGLSFPTFGDPERQKINDALKHTIRMSYQMRLS